VGIRAACPSSGLPEHAGGCHRAVGAASRGHAAVGVQHVGVQHDAVPQELQQ